MIEIPCKQGSPEWIAARVGIATASNFDRIITPKTMKPSGSADGYRNQLLAEWLLGDKLSMVDTDWTARGSALEESAVRFYELQREVDTREVGFIRHDTLPAGCSPDRLVGDDGGLEIKCPSAPVHVGYLLDMGEPYKCQVQGALWITGRKWWDLMSYNPEMPPALIRFERDEEFIRRLEIILRGFCKTLLAAKRLLYDYGYTDKNPEGAGQGTDAGSGIGGGDAVGTPTLEIVGPAPSGLEAERG